MVDRQDIDALLISALYGELTPADEARLQTHLESHPGDKSALADLTLTRNTVRESRFLTVQVEPPQAVSALLLQEASRRKVVVAKEQPAHEGWFSRFVRSFAAHPAIAAAAMLVVVVGVAGTMYLRNGSGQFADQSTSSRMAEQMAPPPATAPAVDEAKLLERNAGSAFEAHLEDTATPAAPTGATAADHGLADGEGGDMAAADKADRQVTEEPAKTKIAAARDDLAKDAKPQKARRTYITTETPKYKPMELDADNGPSKGGRVANNQDAYQITSKPGGARPDPATTRSRPEPVTAMPPPPKPSPAPKVATKAPAQQVRGGAATGDVDDQKKEANEKVDEESRWARDQHVKVANAVRANNCKQASTLALALSNRAPGYFAQNVENDRALKQCMTYINAEREKEAERTQRARALKQRQADEAAKRAAPRPTSTNK